MPREYSRLRRFAAAACAFGTLTLSSGQAGAQTPADSEPSASPVPTLDPSSHEARAAVARTVRVSIDILGVTPGMRVGEARSKLNPLADPKTPAVQEGGAREEKDQDEDDDDNTVQPPAGSPPNAPKSSKPKDNDDEGSGIKILWKLAAGAPYEWIFIQADKDEKIAEVDGYCWPDKPIPFGDIGDVTKAPLHSATDVAWDSLKPPLHYRVTAHGAKGSASQVSVALVWIPTNGVHHAGHH